MVVLFAEKAKRTCKTEMLSRRTKGKEKEENEGAQQSSIYPWCVVKTIIGHVHCWQRRLAAGFRILK